MCVLVGLGVVAFWPAEREPEYDGKTLSEWLLYKPEDSNRANAFELQTEAIRQIGESAVPWLLKWARYKSPPWRRRLERFFGKDRGIERQQAIWFAFRVLGPKASDAIPELTRMMNDPKGPRFYGKPLLALATMGIRGFPPVLAVLQTPRHPDRATAANLIGETQEWGLNRLLAVPALLSCLHSDNYFVAASAETSLGKIAKDQNLTLPDLAGSLSNPGLHGNFDETVDSLVKFVVSQKTPERLRIAATMSLGLMGPRAHQAVPALIRTLDDDDQLVQTAATNALREIMSEAARKEDY